MQHLHGIILLIQVLQLIFVFSFLSTVAFASVDWHDFVVVETVDFKDSETGKTIINHDIHVPCDMWNGECHIRST